MWKIAMNHNTKVLTAILTSLGTLLAGPLPAADEALPDVLLKNGVITKAQRDALTDGKKGPGKPADTITAKPAPANDQGLLDVLLENGLISQAQFAALQVKTAQQKRTEHEARASLKDGIKLKSQDGAFQAQIGTYAQLDSAFYSDNPSDFSTLLSCAGRASRSPAPCTRTVALLPALLFHQVQRLPPPPFLPIMRCELSNHALL
jgi:hypothetical protein